jgi:hypothetical protein
LPLRNVKKDLKLHKIYDFTGKLNIYIKTKTMFSINVHMIWWIEKDSEWKFCRVKNPWSGGAGFERSGAERTAPTPLRSAYFEISAPPLRSAPHISARTAPPLRKKFGGFWTLLKGTHASFLGGKMQRNSMSFKIYSAKL